MGWVDKKLDLNEALTFDDVVILPTYTEVLPHEPDVSSYLTKKIKLHTPFVSSPMESVTEYKLAIAIAQNGGFGFIHRNLTPTEQVQQVKQVKRYEAFLIENPTVVKARKKRKGSFYPTKVKEVLSLREKYGYSTFPVVDENNNLVGIVTDKDVRWRSLDELVEDIMVKDVVTIPYVKNDDKLREMAIEAMRDYRVGCVVVTRRRNSKKIKGLITETDIKKRDKFPYATRDKKGRLMVGAAIGVGEKELERVAKLYEAEVDAIVIDISHGHCKNLLDVLYQIKSKEYLTKVKETVKRVKKDYDIPVVGGNIVTKEAVEDLYSAEADALRVGIGPGSICTTRVVVGIGLPQISAILETAEVARDYGIPIIADGGIKYYGDIAKAIAAGASTVMMGRLFAGTQEAPGELVSLHGRLYKKYFGMASERALKNKAGGGRLRYLEFLDKSIDYLQVFPQGVEGYVDYAGSLSDVINQMREALKKAMAATNSRTIKEFHENAVLRKVSKSGAIEGHPSVTLEKEPINYRKT